MLHVQTNGSGSAGTPLLIAHGLFGSARNWGVISKRLSDERPVHAVDMRNHGASPWNEDHGYDQLADDLGGVLTMPVHVLGHSMGGKAAMMLALNRPEKVDRLIVADIAPVAYSHTQAHLIDAMRQVDLRAVGTRGDADMQLRRHIDDQGLRAFLLQSLDLRQKAWRLNLDALEAEMDKILGFPEVAGTFPGPALFLTGAESDYVGPRHRETIRALFPGARFARIPGAGHWLHAEKPREFEAAVRAFLNA